MVSESKVEMLAKAMLHEMMSEPVMLMNDFEKDTREDLKELYDGFLLKVVLKRLSVFLPEYRLSSMVGLQILLLANNPVVAMYIASEMLKEASKSGTKDVTMMHSVCFETWFDAESPTAEDFIRRYKVNGTWIFDDDRFWELCVSKPDGDAVENYINSFNK